MNHSVKMKTLMTLFLLMMGTAMSFAQDYHLTVAGKEVTSANKGDIMGDGKVSYDPATHTLKLKNANIETGFAGIFTEDRLIIDLEGNNSIRAPRGVESCYNPTSSNDYAITICSSSGGSLSTEGYESAFSVANSGGIYVRDCSITTKQSMSAFYGYISGNNTTLKIEHANIDIQGQSTEACIAGFESLVLEKCDIVEPTNAYFKSAWGYGAMRQGDDDTKCISLKIKAKEATEYGISVSTLGDEVVSVNSENYTNVLGDGTLSYDPSSNVLKMNDVHLFGFAVLDICKKDLCIEVSGTQNSIEGFCTISTSCTLVGNNTKKAVTSQLNVNSIGLSSSLTIQNLAVEFIGSKQGFQSLSGTASLTLKNATVNANGAAGVFKYIPSLVLEDCEILTPEGAYYDAEKKYIVDESGNRVTGVVTIGPKVEPVVEYYIEIGDMMITSENCADVLGDGTLSYDPVANVLELNNVQAAEKSLYIGSFDLSVESMKAMNKDLAGIKVKVTGNNALETLTFHGGVDGTLCGDGTLVLESETVAGSTLHSWDNLLIEDCNLVIKADGYGISLWEFMGAPGKLTIRNASVKINAVGSCITGLSKLVLEGCSILKPSGIDPAKLNGSTANGEFIIGRDGSDVPVTEYNIKVGSTKVTKANCADVLGDGTVSYDPVANVLSLNNLQAAEKALYIGSSSYDHSFETMKSMNKGMAGIKVKVTGDNALEFLYFYGGVDGTLCGDGTLVLEEPNMAGTALSSFDNLLIEDCNLVLRAPDGNGIYMWYNWGWGCPGKLTIRNASVRINTRLECIGDFSSLVLEGCSILKPSGTDPAKLNGSTGCGELLIAKTATPDKGTGTQDDPFELGGTLDEILGGGGTGGTGTGGTGGGSTGGTGTGTGVDGTGSGSYPNPPVIITPPAGTSSHYSYTAKDDCVLGLVVNVGNEFEGRLTINGADAGNIEDREMILHKGDVVMLNIANAGKDDMVGINIRNLCEGDLWNMAIELHEGKNDILKVVENKNLPRWYKVTVPAKTPMAIDIDAKGKAYVFTDENVEKETLDAWFWTKKEGDGIAFHHKNASASPLTFYIKLLAAEKDCTATVSFDPSAISTLSSESDNAPAYNLQGLRVGSDYKGIVIINGKKVLKK